MHSAGVLRDPERPAAAEGGSGKRMVPIPHPAESQRVATRSPAS